MSSPLLRLGIFVSVSTLGFIWATMHSQKRNRKIARYLKGRHSLSEEEYCRTHFPEGSEGILEAKRLLEMEFGIDMSRVIPSDHFESDFGMGEAELGGMRLVIYHLESDLGITLPSASECLRMTVGQFMENVRMAVREKQLEPGK